MSDEILVKIDKLDKVFMKEYGKLLRNKYSDTEKIVAVEILIDTFKDLHSDMIKYFTSEQ